jgi:hypothetical protein
MTIKWIRTKQMDGPLYEYEAHYDPYPECELIAYFKYPDDEESKNE